MAHQHNYIQERVADSTEQFREEKNVLDQNVNGKEVKRVIYFLIARKMKTKDSEQQLKLLIL